MKTTTIQVGGKQEFKAADALVRQALLASAASAKTLKSNPAKPSKRPAVPNPVRKDA